MASAGPVLGDDALRPVPCLQPCPPALFVLHPLRRPRHPLPEIDAAASGSYGFQASRAGAGTSGGMGEAGGRWHGHPPDQRLGCRSVAGPGPRRSGDPDSCLTPDPTASRSLMGFAHQEELGSEWTPEPTHYDHRDPLRHHPRFWILSAASLSTRWWSTARLPAHGAGLPEHGKVTHSGIPVLFPWPNRIAGAHFAWDGSSTTPSPNLPPAPVCTGFACHAKWQVLNADSDRATGEFILSRDAPNM